MLVSSESYLQVTHVQYMQFVLIDVTALKCFTTIKIEKETIK